MNPIAQGAVDSVVSASTRRLGQRRGDHLLLALRGQGVGGRVGRRQGAQRQGRRARAGVVHRAHALVVAPVGGQRADRIFRAAAVDHRALQAVAAHHRHADRRGRRHHRGQRLGHHALRARHLFVRLAARRRAGRPRARHGRLSRKVAQVLPLLRRRHHARRLSAAQVQPRQVAGVVVAPVGRRSCTSPTGSQADIKLGKAAAADPGGRDGAGGLGDVAPLSALPRHRRDEAALWAPHPSRRGLHGRLPRAAHEAAGAVVRSLGRAARHPDLHLRGGLRRARRRRRVRACVRRRRACRALRASGARDPRRHGPAPVAPRARPLRADDQRRRRRQRHSRRDDRRLDLWRVRLRRLSRPTTRAWWRR